MQEFFQNTILPAVMKFVNTRGIRAVKDGLVYSMPLIIVGAVCLLLFQLPLKRGLHDLQYALQGPVVILWLKHHIDHTEKLRAVSEG